MISGVVRAWCLACVALLTLGLGACGGGGGGGGTDNAPLLAELKEDVLPTGTRVDVSGQNLFPMAAGDRWEYQRLSNGVANGTVTDTASSAASGQVRVNTYDGYTGQTSSSVYALQSDGVVYLDPFEAAFDAPVLYAALPQLLKYPTPLYPAGTERRIVRQGSMGLDLDGDGKNDYYRFEYSQVFDGFETLSVLGRDMQVAHFTNTTVLTYRVTTVPSGVRRLTYVEEAYFASGLGLVKADRSEYVTGGVPSQAPYSIVLTSAQVGGVSFTSSNGGTPSPSPSTDGSTISLAHNDLVYDAQRERYYASVPSGAVGKANRIATIDATTGAVSLSASAVGSNPGPMALSADGSTLYVGLSGSSELLRLSVPDLVETGRVALPRDSSSGQMTVQDISVSPTNPNVVAVSLKSPNFSLTAGVALVRDMVFQPTRTEDYRGSKRIAFDRSGGWVIAYEIELADSAVSRLEVLTDGLIQRDRVLTNGGYSAEIDLFGNSVMLGGLAYAVDTLTLRGTMAMSQRSCVHLRGVDKVACVRANDSLVRVADTATFGLQAELSYFNFLTDYSEPRLVAGPIGQVALSNGKEIRRITNAALR